MLRLLSLSLGLATSIVAARSLGSNELGVSGVLASIVSQAGIVTGSCLDLVLVRKYIKAKAADRDKLINDALSVRLAFAIVAGGAAIIVSLVTQGRTEWVFLAFTGFVMLLSQAFSLVWILQATHKIVEIQRSLVLQSVLGLALVLTLCTLHPVGGIDLLAQALALLGANYYVYTIIEPSFSFRHFTIGFRGLSLLWESKWVVFSMISIQAYVSADIPLIAWIRSDHEAGIYRVAQNFASSLQSVLSITTTLLYPKLVQWNQEDQTSLYKKQIQAFTVTGAIIASAIALPLLLSEWAVTFLYGVQYSEAIPILRLLIVAKAVLVWHGVFSTGLWAQGRDRELFLVVATTALVSLISNAALLPALGASGAAWTSLGCEILVLTLSLKLSMGKMR